MEDKWNEICRWMDSYGDKITRTLYLMTGDEELAQDLAQEVFISAYRGKAFQGKSSEYTYLYRITLNIFRSYSRNNKKLLSFQEFNEQFHSKNNTTDPLEHVTAKHERQVIRSAVSNLPLKYKEVAVLHYFAEMKIKDISVTLNSTENTIKTRLHRARIILEKTLRKEGFYA